MLLREGSTNQAEQIFRRIVQTNPKLVTAHRLLADFLVLQGNLPEAATQYAIAVDLQPNAALRRAYAPILARLGKEEEAIVQLKEALSADPKDAAVNFELAEMLSQAGHDTQAVICYEKILSSHPDDIGVLNNLAWILATSSEQKLRDGQRAVELATRACQITDWKSAFLIGTLAAAYAESGSFSNAIAIGEKARDIARNGNLEEVAKRNESLIALYRAGKPYREQIINTNKPK